MRVAVIIPALNEAQTIAEVIAGVPPGLADEIWVVDGGSDDGTPERARAAGARVIDEPRPGYGRACWAGAQRAAREGAEILAFLDAACAEDPTELPTLIAPIEAGEADLVLGSRVLGEAEPGALRPLQRAGNRLATWLIWRLDGQRYTDLGSMRAIHTPELLALDMRERHHGWPVEMQVRAARAGLRIREVPIRYRRRRAGRSKISGTLRGTLGAGAAILRVVLWSAR